MNMMYRKMVPSTILKVLILVILGILVLYNNHDHLSCSPKVILRNFNSQAGFHYNIYCINHALYACEQSKRELVVLFDSGLYKEDRPHFIDDNPYYNKYDWFSYYFEPINQTDKPLSYWKKWVFMHPLVTPIASSELKTPILKNGDLRAKNHRVRVFTRSSI